MGHLSREVMKRVSVAPPGGGRSPDRETDRGAPTQVAAGLAPVHLELDPRRGPCGGQHRGPCSLAATCVRGKPSYNVLAGIPAP